MCFGCGSSTLNACDLECEHEKWYLFLNFAIQKHYYYVSRFIIAQPFNFIVQMQTNIALQCSVRIRWLVRRFSLGSVYFFVFWISSGRKVFHCSQFDTLVLLMRSNGKMQCKSTMCKDCPALVLLTFNFMYIILVIEYILANARHSFFFHSLPQRKEKALTTSYLLRIQTTYNIFVWLLDTFFGWAQQQQHQRSAICKFSIWEQFFLRSLCIFRLSLFPYASCALCNFYLQFI